jgi:pilus assembly protein CpaB
MLTRQIDSQGDEKRNGTTDVLLQGVKVLAVDQLADDRADKPDVVKTVTLEVSTLEAQKLTLASTIGTLSLTLRNSASSQTEEVAAIDLSDLGSGEKATTLPAAPVAEKAPAESNERLNNLEQLVRSVGEKVDAQLTKPQPDVAKEQPGPTTIGVGVYRNTERTEYKVIPIR